MLLEFKFYVDLSDFTESRSLVLLKADLDSVPAILCGILRTSRSNSWVHSQKVSPKFSSSQGVAQAQ